MRLRFALTLLILSPVMGQRPLDYDRSVVSQVRIDLRELGYPPVDVIPSEESAVRALAVAPDGALYGVTSGRRSHLFVLHPAHGYVQPLGYLNGVSTVYNSLAVSRKGEVYVGSGDKDGHLFRYAPPANEDEQPIRVDAPVEVADLGAPAAGEGIYALAISPGSDTIYGVTHPGGQFFSYSVMAGEFHLSGKVAENPAPGENFEQEKSIGRAIVVGDNGSAYTSGENGALFRAFGTSLQKLPVSLPGVPGREPFQRVDAWAAGPCGALYGGTSDGYLFRFDPERLAIENLGKPLNQYRIRGLAFSRNGKLYGVGGDDDEMARLFSYDPARGAYELLGMIDVNRRPFYTWQAYVIGAMAIGLDDTIYFGQAERRSKLYLYYPESLDRAPAPCAR